MVSVSVEGGHRQRRGSVKFNMTQTYTNTLSSVGHLYLSEHDLAYVIVLENGLDPSDRAQTHRLSMVITICLLATASSFLLVFFKLLTELVNMFT
jgi:hypothetical protein